MWPGGEGQGHGLKLCQPRAVHCCRVGCWWPGEADWGCLEAQQVPAVPTHSPATNTCSLHLKAFSSCRSKEQVKQLFQMQTLASHGWMTETVCPPPPSSEGSQGPQRYTGMFSHCRPPPQPLPVPHLTPSFGLTGIISQTMTSLSTCLWGSISALQLPVATPMFVSKALCGERTGSKEKKEGAAAPLLFHQPRAAQPQALGHPPVPFWAAPDHQ